MTKTKLEAIFWLVIGILLALLWAFVSPFLRVLAIPLALWGKGKYRQYGWNVWEGFDNATSAEMGGDPDETLSSRLGKARKRGSGWSSVANKVDLVFGELLGDKGHCDRSIEPDEGKKQVTNY